MGNLIRIEKDEGFKREWGRYRIVSTNLVYDSETKVVYYQFVHNEAEYSSGKQKWGYMSPYISENGKFCRFIDNQIVEIG